MGTTHRSASHIWDLALRKLFPKRGSLSRETDSHSSWGNLDASAIDDHTDGFYKYSQEVLEKERLRSSNSTTGSYESALMAPTGLPQIPYTVSSPDWNIFSPGVKALSETNDDSICEWLSSVLGVWSRVYSISKVAVMAFMHYGVDLHNTPDSILAHIKRAEKLVTSNSITDLVDNTESMYYALYAALIMELAAADLCASFTLEIRRMVVNRGFVLPEPGQLCKILFLCKQTLDDPSVCVDLNSELVQQHQKEYIRCGVAKVPIAGFVLDDLVGYRQYALTLINDENSEFCQRWNRESVLYEMPPDEVLALQSEKYLAFMPKSTIQRVAPALNLPFIDIDTVHPDIRERDHILDNRQATLAKLEGKCIGEVRCQDTRRRLINLVRERKCICRAVCICATECTENIERYCPCAERMLSLMVAKRRNSIGPLPFGSRCSALAKAIFQGVASIRLDADDKEIAAELDRATMIFAEEIRKQRISGTPSAVSSWASPSSSSPLQRTSASSSPLALHRKWIWGPEKTLVRRYHRAVWPSYGITTPVPDRCPQFPILKSPYCFQTGYALCAKRRSRPFPPPFLSPPSSSFSDPLTTHYHSQDKRLSVKGELIRGLNNGDDAVLVTENFLGVNDGVGAWATKPRGHAALWSRLILHFWCLEVERLSNPDSTVDPVEYLQRAYEQTTQATTAPSEWFGTTTSVTALLHKTVDGNGAEKPLLYVTNIGDCKVLVIRPSEDKVLFRTVEQWHWFDCPMQLGTNSVDTPRNNAVLSLVNLEEGDIVLALSDGVLDNLWEHEVLSITMEGLKKWDHGRWDDKELEWAPPAVLAEEKMVYLAREILKAALAVAQDPFAESPYMEKAVEEGLAIQGGKQSQENGRYQAKRSKKYRKLMHQYELAFGFREPYQVLVDSNLLRAVQSFKMDLIPALERTLQGQVKPLLTKCSLASIMANQPTNPRTNNTVRPDFLPPPTTLPLRHCSHNADSTPIEEEECLLSLLSPLADVKKNKEHYILATSDPPAPKAQPQDVGKKRKRGDDEAFQKLLRAQGLRRNARSIPGVPIVYVKRSVMILEPMSAPSEGIREGVEQDKFRVGLNQNAGKSAAGGGERKKKDMKKVKEPNPLSVKKSTKKKVAEKDEEKRQKRSGDFERDDGAEKVDGDRDAAPKAKRRRRHGKGARLGDSGENGGEPVAAASVDGEDD
ncbi:hypothetical protein BJY04DRAFT_205864 [Aspergillus karnatakaensis]|uniref:uncharacterized protein n=1 Tax=Aspergillus karnatakaensis TaxID=1810916 RepID=UPI003CCDFB5D